MKTFYVSYRPSVFTSINTYLLWICEQHLGETSTTHIFSTNLQPPFLAPCDIAWTFSTVYTSKLQHITDIFHLIFTALHNLPAHGVKPEKQRALRRYLGMVNYYHRFIPHCAAKLTPLNNLLTSANEGHTRLSPKSNFDLKWNKNAESAFSESKQILAKATLLVHPDSTAQLNITCDASDVAVGGVLQQFLNGMWQPLSFFSKKLNPAETRYSAFDRELLAVYATIKHFRHNLEGRNFFVNTDHKPLTFVMSSVTERASLRQTRHLAFIAEFTTDIRYVKGETNLVADALSRPSVSAIHDGPVIDYKELSLDQANDAEFTRLRHSTTSTMNFKLLKSFNNQLIWCDVSTGHNWPYLTAKFRRKVFSNLHGLGHPSHRATRPLINTRFVWHGMNIDIARWCRTCKGC